MKISELQEILEKFKQKYGDLNIFTETISGGEYTFALEKDDVVAIYDPHGKSYLLKIYA